MRGFRIWVVAGLSILLLSILLNVPGASAQDEYFTPTSVLVRGEVVDNYANISYVLVFDNTGETEAREVDWFIGLQDDLRLSNMSLVLGNLTYWGRAEREQTAIEEYEEAVEHNATAVLITRRYDGYSLSVNIEAGESATLSVFMEGLLTRRMGVYSLGLPLSDRGAFQADFEVDLRIISNYGPVAGYSVEGLDYLSVTDLTNGIHLTYSMTGLLVSEKISIRYALDRQVGGSQMLTYTNSTDNFFVYMLAPVIDEVAEQAPRQYVFVMDRSGSMTGIKIAQAKIAFNSMIEGLSEHDLFNIVSFSSDVTMLWTEPHSANPAHIEEAQTWVNSISASGSTNFHDACTTGLGTFTDSEDVKAMLVLSDGLPTAGITDSNTILSDVAEANSLGVSISTVAFGYDADEALMASMAIQNSGYFAIIEESEDAATHMLDFYMQLCTPVADDYNIDIDGATDLAHLKPLTDSPFFNGTEVVIAGRYSESLTINTRIDYVTGTENYTNTATVASTENKYVEYMWVQYRISYLVQMVQLEGVTDALTDEIVNLALSYGIIVEGYTAIIISLYESAPEDHETAGGFLQSQPGTYTNAPPPGTYTSAPPGYASVSPDLSMSIPSILLPFGVVALVVGVSVKLLKAIDKRNAG